MHAVCQIACEVCCNAHTPHQPMLASLSHSILSHQLLVWGQQALSFSPFLSHVGVVLLSARLPVCPSPLCCAALSQAHKCVRVPPNSLSQLVTVPCTSIPPASLCGFLSWLLSAPYTGLHKRKVSVLCATCTTWVGCCFSPSLGYGLIGLIDCCLVVEALFM